MHEDAVEGADGVGRPEPFGQFGVRDLDEGLLDDGRPPISTLS
jgi:hypothetical protein